MDDTEPARRSIERRLSNEIADRITHDTLAARQAPGTLIGHESDLMHRYGVSRATLREAIRQIEARGVAQMRRGSNGGLFVAGTALSIASDTLATYLEISDITLGEQIEARFLLETLAAGLAASRIDGNGIAALRTAVAGWAGVTDPVQAGRLHFALRRSIVGASGNRALAFAATALFQVTQDVSALLTGSGGELADYLDRQIASKTALVEAIAAGDAGTARALVRAEEATVLTAASIQPHLGTPLPDLVLRAGDHGARREDDKLGMATALRIRRSIAALGWPRGRNIGAEEALRAQFGVSRGLLREALMLLETHGIVRFVRGRSGGILIDRPDPQAAIGAILTLLRPIVAGSGDVADVLPEIDLLVSRRAADDRAAALSALSRAPRPADYPALIERMRGLAGNRVLDLVAAILREVDPGGARPPGERSGAIAQWQAAVLAGDGAIAQRWLRRVWAD